MLSAWWLQNLATVSMDWTELLFHTTVADSSVGASAALGQIPAGRCCYCLQELPRPQRFCRDDAVSDDHELQAVAVDRDGLLGQLVSLPLLVPMLNAVAIAAHRCVA